MYTDTNPKSRFRYFVILGTMRSGSNFLEEQLNGVNDVSCYGELFNPVFVGRHNQETFCGIDMIQREADPESILDVLRADDQCIGGFRYFDGHDPRVFDTFLADPECAKIVLVRNPLDSFISLGIAKQTGQWKLTNFTRRRAAKADFDADEFDEYLTEVDSFYHDILTKISVSGQAVFFLNYDDLQNIDVFNGLLRYLGSSTVIEKFKGKTKKQNPGHPETLVQNPETMKDALSEQDRFGLRRPLWFEPKRNFHGLTVLSTENPDTVFVPLGSGPHDHVVRWMKSIAANRSVLRTTRVDELDEFLSHHRSAVKFTLVEHPLRRAYDSFSQQVLMNKGERWETIRRVLKQQHGIAIPAKGIPKNRWSVEAHSEAFLGFLRFLKANLAGLTGLPRRPDWVSQMSLLEYASKHVCFDCIVKSPRLIEDMALLSVRLNVDSVELNPRKDDNIFPLKDVVTPKMHELIADAYIRDFNAFGFVDWEPESDLY